MKRISLVAVGLLLVVVPAFAEPGYQEVHNGNDLYQKGEFSKAISFYKKAAEKNPDAAAVDYNLGAGYYKTGEYGRAVAHFRRALLTDDQTFLPNVHYNLGNALYRMGISHEADDVKQGVEQLEEALSHYEETMKALPEDEDAKNNYDFVKRELERLKQKQKQQESGTCPNPSAKKELSEDSGSSGQDASAQGGDKDSSAEAKDDRGRQMQGQTSSGDGQEEQTEQQSLLSSRADEEQEEDAAGQEMARSSAGDEKEDPAQAGQRVEDELPRNEQDGKNPVPSSGEGEENKDASGQFGQASVLSPKEADMILDDFDQNEQPKGLLNFMRKYRDEKPVEKDW